MKQHPNQEPCPPLDFWKKVEMVERLSFIPALSIMPFLRPRDIGYSTIHLPVVFINAVCLFILSTIFSPDAPSIFGDDLSIFAVVFCVVAFTQRMRAWLRLMQGHLSHSGFPGTSICRFKWLPDVCTRSRRIERFIDPFAAFLFGLFLSEFSYGLGCWLMFAGVCLRIYEYRIFKIERTRLLDTVDSLALAGAHSEVIDDYRLHSQAEPRRTSRIATGLDGHLKKRVN